MRRRPLPRLGLAAGIGFLLTACSDGGTGPGDDHDTFLPGPGVHLQVEGAVERSIHVPDENSGMQVIPPETGDYWIAGGTTTGDDWFARVAWAGRGSIEAGQSYPVAYVEVSTEWVSALETGEGGMSLQYLSAASDELPLLADDGRLEIVSVEADRVRGRFVGVVMSEIDPDTNARVPGGRSATLSGTFDVAVQVLEEG